MVEVELLTLCEAATTYENGRLNILGTFDSITEEFFPFTYTAFLVGKVVFSHEEPDDHILHFRLTSETEVYLMGFGEQSVVLNPPEQKGVSRSFGFVAKMNDMKFKFSGKYYIDLYVDSKLAKRIAIYVNRQL